MKAREAMMFGRGIGDAMPSTVVEGSMPLIEVLLRLLDATGRLVGVVEAGSLLGVIDESSLLEGLGRLIAARHDSSEIVLECAAADFSASRIAMAVEDADVHLVDMLTSPGKEGKVSVMLRVRTTDPASVAASLRRHGYDVTEMSAGSEAAEMGLVAERLLELQALINV